VDFTDLAELGSFADFADLLVGSGGASRIAII
jgi:hypothetical protein